MRDFTDEEGNSDWELSISLDTRKYEDEAG